ncbi:MAG: hypothetical protein ACO3JL_15775, partial [Myxococcota bacterium]
MRIDFSRFALCAVVGFLGCASVPQYRPVYDLPSDHRVELGVVPQAGLGVSSQDRSPTGATPGATTFVIDRMSAEL